MKRLCSFILALLFAVGMTTTGVAAGAEKKEPPIFLTYNLQGNQVFHRDVVLNSSKVSTISPDATIILEEGHTLTVYGQLIIDGTLINKGTIRMLSSKKEGSLPGIIENKGRFVNSGTLLVQGGNYRNRASGKLENHGQITIQGETEKQIYFGNYLAAPLEGIKKPGYILNMGTISIENTAGYGFVNTGVIDNQGTIVASATATHSNVELRDPAAEAETAKKTIEEPTGENKEGTTPEITSGSQAPSSPTEETKSEGASTPSPATEPVDPNASRKAFNRFAEGGNTGKM